MGMKHNIASVISDPSTKDLQLDVELPLGENDLGIYTCLKYI